MTKEWTRLAGIYIRTSDAVRAANYNTKVSDAEFRVLVEARERAFAAMAASGTEVQS